MLRTPGSTHSDSRAGGISGNCGAIATGLPDVAQALNSGIRHAAAITRIFKLIDDLVTSGLQLLHFLLGLPSAFLCLFESLLRRVTLALKLVHGLLKLLGLTLLPGSIRSLISLVGGPREEGEPDQNPPAERAGDEGEQPGHSETSFPVWCFSSLICFSRYA